MMTTQTTTTRRRRMCRRRLRRPSTNTTNVDEDDALWDHHHRDRRGRGRGQIKHHLISIITAAKKGGAFLKEFAPEPSPEEKRKREERERKERMERTGGFPELSTTTDDDEKVFNCNIVVKTKGFGVTWNGIGTLTVPDGGTKEMSTNIARVCCAQRKALLRANCTRLYPKMQKLPMEWAVQPFDDPYADPLDLDMVLEGEHANEMIQGTCSFSKKAEQSDREDRNSIQEERA